MSKVKSKRLWLFADLFFWLPPAADRWPGVLPRIHKPLLLLRRWAGTCRSETPCDTPQLLVLWDQNNKLFQYCISVLYFSCLTFQGALQHFGLLSRWEEKQNIELVAGKCQENMSLAAQGHVFATQRYVFVWEKFWTTADQQRQGREGLPEEHGAGSSYGNRGWCEHQQLRASSLAMGSSSWIAITAQLLGWSPERLRQMNQSFVLTLQRS